jgi:hypothetical protein
MSGLGAFNKKLPVTWQSADYAQVWVQDGLVPLDVVFTRMSRFDTFFRIAPDAVTRLDVRAVVFGRDGDTVELTRLGEPTTVLGNVARVIRQFIDRVQPDIIAFSAERKRAAVYMRMAKRLGHHGYAAFLSSGYRDADDNFFAIVRNEYAQTLHLAEYGFRRL